MKEIPEWATRWTVAEAHDILLLDHPDFKVELPIERVPAETTLAEIWRTLSDDCRLILQVERDNFS